MIIKIGNRLYTSANQPIMVILSDTDKENIAKMLPEAHNYCAFPAGRDAGEIEKFMDIPFAVPFETPADTTMAREYHIEHIDDSHVRLTPID